MKSGSEFRYVVEIWHDQGGSAWARVCMNCYSTSYLIIFICCSHRQIWPAAFDQCQRVKLYTRLLYKYQIFSTTRS